MYQSSPNYKITFEPTQRFGFTLVEIAVVVACLGIIFAIAAPMIQKSVDSTEGQVVINDLRVFSEAFNRYNMENNTWPETPELGTTFPEGMQGYLSESGWDREHPYGGKYEWFHDLEVDDQIITASITIKSGKATLDEMKSIDEVIDDGDLMTGIFRLGLRNDPMLILEQ